MRSRRSLLPVAATLSFVLVHSAVVRADPILVDQISPVATGTGVGSAAVGCCAGENLAQTFTVGISGILRSIALPLSKPQCCLNDDFSGQLSVQLRPTLAGGPADSVLAEMVLLKSGLPPANSPEVSNGFTTLWSGLGLPVAAGQQFAIVFSNVGHNGQNIRLALNALGSYSGGEPYKQPREGTQLADAPGNVTGPWRRDTPCCTGEFDYAFVTSVEPTAAPTPEPGTLLLLGIGLFGFTGARLRAHS